MKGTKNHRTRRFKVSKWVMEYLREAWEIQQENAKRVQNYKNESGLVFTEENGRMLCKNTAIQAFKRMMENTSNPRVTSHALRRTFASIGVEAGKARAVQNALGHVRVRTTIRYVYPMEKDEKHLVRTMSEHYSPMLKTILGDEMNDKDCRI